MPVTQTVVSMNGQPKNAEQSTIDRAIETDREILPMSLAELSEVGGGGAHGGNAL